MSVFVYMLTYTSGLVLDMYGDIPHLKIAIKTFNTKMIAKNAILLMTVGLYLKTATSAEKESFLFCKDVNFCKAKNICKNIGTGIRM